MQGRHLQASPYFLSGLVTTAVPGAALLKLFPTTLLHDGLAGILGDLGSPFQAQITSLHLEAKPYPQSREGLHGHVLGVLVQEGKPPRFGFRVLAVVLSGDRRQHRIVKEGR